MRPVLRRSLWQIARWQSGFCTQCTYGSLVERLTRDEKVKKKKTLIISPAIFLGISQGRTEKKRHARVYVNTATVMTICARFGFVLRLDTPYFIVSCIAGVIARVLSHVYINIYIDTKHAFLHTVHVHIYIHTYVYTRTKRRSRNIWRLRYRTRGRRVVFYFFARVRSRGGARDRGF